MFYFLSVFQYVLLTYSFHLGVEVTKMLIQHRSVYPDDLLLHWERHINYVELRQQTICNDVPTTSRGTHGRQ